MKLSIATAVAALCALLALGSAALLGAPMKHDAKDFENYLDEAHYVEATQVDGREFYDTVVEILEAETQPLEERKGPGAAKYPRTSESPAGEMRDFGSSTSRCKRVKCTSPEDVVEPLTTLPRKECARKCAYMLMHMKLVLWLYRTLKTSYRRS
ncbi:uncharacterized protein LOC119167043 [Rhipicephalus microplus]|uniref:uncharacterized protein LOC119167043 n=1 Tax=Rhipicephalus microplus TaxID=6941 RepID=UPI003F6B6099